MTNQPRYDDAARAWSLPDEVDCAIGGEIVALPVADLQCDTGAHETEHEWCSWIEFRRTGDAEPIHRSVRLHLKQPVLADGAIATLA